jgi:hypothetical protein
VDVCVDVCRIEGSGFRVYWVFATQLGRICAFWVWGGGGVGGVWFKGFVALGLTWPSLIKFKEDFKKKVRGF